MLVQLIDKKTAEFNDRLIQIKKLFKLMSEHSNKSYFIQEMMKRRLVETLLIKTISRLTTKCEDY